MRRRAVIHHPTPPPGPSPAPMQGTGTLWREVEAVGEGLRLLWAWRRLARAPRGPAGAVMTFPGYGASERVMAPLGAYLRARGHAVRPWGLGVNQGDPEGDTWRALPRVRALHEATGRRVTLVGWSLGGVVAREVARELPGAVERVVTYGTPVVGGPTYTVAAGVWGPDECARIGALSALREAEEPLQVPVTAIFTRGDRVVHWAATVDRRSPRAHHVEVRSTHVGMGFDPDVWEVIAASVEGRLPVAA